MVSPREGTAGGHRGSLSVDELVSRGGTVLAAGGDHEEEDDDWF